MTDPSQSDVATRTGRRPCPAVALPSRSHEIFEAAGAEATLALLSATRGAARIRSRGPGGMRMVHDRIGPVSLDHVTFTMDLDADVGPADGLVFGQANAGTVGFRTGHAEHWHTIGDPYLAAQPGRPRTSMIRGSDHDQLILDPALIARVAQTAPGRIQQPPKFTGYYPISTGAAQTWKATCAYIRDTLLALPGTGAYPLVAANAARLLAASALAVFPNNTLTDPTSQDRHDAHTDTLRRAVAFIDEHAPEDITVADIASAAFVTIRAVQLAFRRHMDITPMGYLRQVRLGRAHHDLQSSTPDGDTVTAVAYRWGFSNPSHFGGLYRQAYGISPSHTLRTD